MTRIRKICGVFVVIMAFALAFHRSSFGGEGSGLSSQGQPYHRIFKPMPKVHRIPLEEERMLNQILIQRDKAAAKTYEEPDVPSQYYFFSDGRDLYLFTPAESSPDSEKRLISELLSSRLEALFHLSGHIAYDCQMTINRKKVSGSLRFFDRDSRLFQLKDYKKLTQQSLDRMLREYVFDLLIGNRRAARGNVLVIGDNPSTFKVTNREAAILFIDNCTQYNASCCLEGSVFYSNFWFLWNYCFIKINFDVGHQFAEYIENCPDEYLVEIAKPIFQKYGISEGGICSLLARKNNLVRIYEESLKEEVVEECRTLKNIKNKHRQRLKLWTDIFKNPINNSF